MPAGIPPSRLDAIAAATDVACSPAMLAALRAGSDGVLLSRKYSEMKLANLRGAGAGIKAFGLA